MKKINFLMLFTSLLSFGLFAQDTEALENDEEIINEIIQDRNIDYILDVDSLFDNGDEENSSTPNEATSPTSSSEIALPNETNSQNQTIPSSESALSTEPSPSTELAEAVLPAQTIPQSVTPAPSVTNPPNNITQQTTITPPPAVTPPLNIFPQTIITNQGDSNIVFNIENFFYRNNPTNNTASLKQQNRAATNSTEKARNEIFIIIKKEENNEMKKNDGTTKPNEVVIDNPVVKPTPEKKDDSYLVLGLIKIVRLVKDGNYEVALKKISALRKTFPLSTRLYNIEGSIYYKLKFYDFALKTWQKSLMIDPDQPSVEKFAARAEQLK